MNYIQQNFLHGRGNLYPDKGRVADDGREFQKLISIIVDHI